MIINQSVQLIKIFLDLFAGQYVEFSVFSDYGHLDVRIVHLSFESLLQGQKSGMDCIFDLHVRFKSFLKESFGIFCTFSDCGGFPVIVSARGVQLS